MSGLKQQDCGKEPNISTGRPHPRDRAWSSGSLFLPHQLQPGWQHLLHMQSLRWGRNGGGRGDSSQSGLWWPGRQPSPVWPMRAGCRFLG